MSIVNCVTIAQNGTSARRARGVVVSAETSPLRADARQADNASISG